MYRRMVLRERSCNSSCEMFPDREVLPALSLRGLVAVVVSVLDHALVCRSRVTCDQNLSVVPSLWLV